MQSKLKETPKLSGTIKVFDSSGNGKFDTGGNGQFDSNGNGKSKGNG